MLVNIAVWRDARCVLSVHDVRHDGLRQAAALL